MRGLYPGSFDPFHAGHLRVVERASDWLDEVVVAVVTNPAKASTKSIEERASDVKAHVAHLSNVRVVWHDGLSTDLARQVEADVLLRGAARAARSEMEMVYMNQTIADLPTVFLPAEAETWGVSSTAIRAFGLND